MTFQKETISINGIACSVYSAGSGHPVVFFHGGGTWHGFDFALPWTATNRVIIPIHPGWGDSADDPSMTTLHDYVMHNLELIDQLCLDQIDLVGMSMGGRMAAQFAAEHRRRVRKLVLVAPAGLDAPGYPLADFSKIPEDQALSYLTEDPQRVLSHAKSAPLPNEPQSFVRVLPDLMDRKFTRWLHRVTMPSLLVWGEADRVTPIQQATEWQRHIPNLQLKTFPGGGHLLLDEQPAASEAIHTFLNA